MNPQRPHRRPDIDWLRALAVLLLVPYHAALVFCRRGIFPLRSGEDSRFLEYFAGVVDQWHMPLLFVISGAGTWFALCFKRPKEYVRERTRRLLVPLVFGTLAIVPPQVYVQRVNEGLFTGSFSAFYPHFFQGIYPEGNFTYNHLWFVAYLYVFSLIALPAFIRLGGEAGGRWISRLGVIAEKSGGIFLLAIPVAVSEATLRAAFPGLQNLVWDWANFVSYLVLFVLGFVLFADERFGKALYRDSPLALALGLTTTALGVSLHLTGTAPDPGYSPAWMYYMVLRAFNMWFWIVAILGMGRRLLFFSNRGLAYVTEATYPFYILHMTVIVLIAFPVMQWNAALAVRYLFIVLTSIVVTVITYDLLVRRWRGIRPLFGMK